MPTTITPRPEHQGIIGAIDRYTIVTTGDCLTVADAHGVVAERTVAGLATFLATAKSLRLSWGVLPAGEEVLYLYDHADHNFGYALNLTVDWCSEWGYVPFPCVQCDERDAKGGDAE